MSSKDMIDVYVMRGLMGFLFRKAMYPIAREFKAQGYNSYMMSWQGPEQSKILKNAIKRNKETNGKNKVVIIGHSMGGNACTLLSKAFKDAGLEIDYLGVIDAPIPKLVYDSVKVVDNFYQFNDWRDPTLDLENSKKTILTQYNYRGTDGPGRRMPKKGHISIASDEFLIKRVFEQVKKLEK